VHVTDGVDVDQGPDAGDDQHHQHREGVHAEVPGDVKSADVYPLGEWDDMTFPPLVQSKTPSSADTTKARPEAALATVPMTFSLMRCRR